jgi:hypothetical protein
VNIVKPGILNVWRFVYDLNREGNPRKSLELANGPIVALHSALTEELSPDSKLVPLWDNMA